MSRASMLYSKEYVPIWRVVVTDNFRYKWKRAVGAGVNADLRANGVCAFYGVVVVVWCHGSIVLKWPFRCTTKSHMYVDFLSALERISIFAYQLRRRAFKLQNQPLVQEIGFDFEVTCMALG